MHARSPKLLEDIQDAAAFIGEVVKRLAQVDPPCAGQIAQYPQIIAFRNVLIHGYDLVDHALVWSTVQTQLPALLRNVQALLAPPA